MFKPNEYSVAKESTEPNDSPASHPKQLSIWCVIEVLMWHPPSTRLSKGDKDKDKCISGIWTVSALAAPSWGGRLCSVATVAPERRYDLHLQG